MVVAAVDPGDPADLGPAARAGHPAASARAGAGPPTSAGLGSRLAALRTRLMGDPRGRPSAGRAAVVVVGLLAAIGGWWVGSAATRTPRSWST